MSDKPLPVRALVVGALCVAALRLMLSVRNPDLVHPIDPAELAHLQVIPAWLDGRLGWLLGADANVHHGGFFWLGTVVGGIRALTGSDLLAVRGVAAVLAGTAWAVWVALAHRLGGRGVAWALGVMLAVPTPWVAQWSATLWGSHSEAAVWTGAWGLLLTGERRPRTLGAVLGAGAAWDPLLWPTAVWTLAVAPDKRRLLQTIVPAWVAVRLPTLLADPSGVLSTSLSEHPGHTLAGLVGAALQPSMLAATLSSYVPLPWTSAMGAGSAQWGLDLVLTLAVGVSGVLLLWTHRRSVAVYRWLVLAPWLHLGVILLAAPTRPQLTHRYLLAWWPAWILVPWLLPGRWRVLGLAPVLATLAAVPVLAQALLTPGPSVWNGYRAADFQFVGLDRVPAHRVEGVEAYLDARCPEPTQAPPAPLRLGTTVGFAAAFSPRWGYPVWGEPFPAQVRAPALGDRLRRARADSAAEDAHVDADLGFGLWVVCDRDTGCVDAAVRSLKLEGIDTTAVERGANEACQRMEECPSHGAVVPEPTPAGRGLGCP